MNPATTTSRNLAAVVVSLSLAFAQLTPAFAAAAATVRAPGAGLPVSGIGAAGTAGALAAPLAGFTPTPSAPVRPTAPTALPTARLALAAPAAILQPVAQDAAPALMAPAKAAEPAKAEAAPEGKPVAQVLEHVAAQAAKPGAAGNGLAKAYDGGGKADLAAAVNLADLTADIARRTGLTRANPRLGAPRIAVVAAARLPQGKFPTSYSKKDSAKTLGTKLAAGLLESAGLSPNALKGLAEAGNEVKVLFGAVDNSESPDIGREIAVALGLTHIPGTGLAKNCGTSLEAVSMALSQIAAGHVDIVLAGGAESMSRLPLATKDPVLKQQFMTLAVLPSMMASAPFLKKPAMAFVYAKTWTAHKWRLATTHHRFAITEGLPIDGDVMAATAQRLADKYGVTRSDMDWFAYASQNRAEKATREGAFADEVLPYRTEKGEETVDQGIRFGQSRKGFASSKIKPVFGTDDITAANASQISDGASGVLMMSEAKAKELGLTPLAYVTAVADTAGDPREMGIQPAYAIPKALKKAGVALSEIQIFEVNEAFAAQSLAVLRALGLPGDKVNVRGGAIALGHPLAASGARILTTLIHTMMHKGFLKGACSLCIGGGEGIAAVVERDPNGVPAGHVAALKAGLAARGVSAAVLDDVERTVNGLPPVTEGRGETDRFLAFLGEAAGVLALSYARPAKAAVPSEALARRLDERLRRVKTDLAVLGAARGAYKTLRVSVDRGVALVVIDREPVNALNAELVGELDAAVSDLSARQDVKSIVITGRGRTFVAGADITLISKAKTPEEAAEKAAGLQHFLDRLEASDKPVLVAINGQALGGGSELSIAAHERWAAGTAELGQPEVALLFNPGAGATQRLTRLVGLTKALTMMNSGAAQDAYTAKEMGWVDQVVPPAELLTRAIARARTLAAMSEPARAAWAKAHRTLEKPVRLTLTERIGMLFNGWLIRRAVAAETRKLGKEVALPAMMGIIDATLAGVKQGPKAGLAKEVSVFGRLAASPASNLAQRLFLRNSGGPKIDGATDGTVTPLPIRRVGVVGAGAMGAGIAQLAAYSDTPVVLKDMAQGPLQAGLDKIEGLFQGLVEKLKFSPEQADEKFSLVTGVTDEQAFHSSDVDLVIEAVKEDMGLKKRLFAQWGKQLPEKTILASNTSALSVTELALASGRPGKVVGLHYFNPPHKLPLVELIVPDRAKLSPAERLEQARTLASVIPFLKKTGRLVVVSQDSPGFIVNRILVSYTSEAMRLVEEGAGIAQVDGVMLQLGLPMGPFKLADHVGFFLGIEVGDYLQNSLPHMKGRSLLLKVLKAWGHEGAYWGRKSGFYAGGTPQEALVREAAAVAAAIEKAGVAPADLPKAIAEFSLRKAELARSLPRRRISDDEIRRRLVMRMADEGRRIVDSGVVSSPDEVDLAMTTGMGFPVQTGGLMRYVQTQLP